MYNKINTEYIRKAEQWYIIRQNNSWQTFTLLNINIAMKQFGSSFVNLRRDIAKDEELNFST